MGLLNNCGILIALIGIASAHISLRSNLLRTEREPFQVFFACAGNTFDFGAGIAITNKHVLTTAALVRGFASWNVGFGSESIMNLQYIESTIAFMHPNYNTQTHNNNLGVIVLPKPFPADLVSPIALPAENDPSFPRINQEGKIVGFGIIDETKLEKPAPNTFLKTVYLTVRTNGECIERFPNIDTNRNFCANDDNADSTNVCKGDLGSAFVVTQRGQKILAGLTSIVSDGCKSMEKTAYIRVQSYLPWIHSVTSTVFQVAMPL